MIAWLLLCGVTCDKKKPACCVHCARDCVRSLTRDPPMICNGVRNEIQLRSGNLGMDLQVLITLSFSASVTNATLHSVA